MYNQQDVENNRRMIRKETRFMLLCMLPFVAVAIAAFILRIELLCIAAVGLTAAVVIFLWDLKLGPHLRYRSFLGEITTGMTRQTVGELVRVCPDPVYQDGVYSREIFINIYEDLSEDGERRFLLDCVKEIDEGFMGKDIVVTSHGSYAVDIVLNGGQA